MTEEEKEKDEGEEPRDPRKKMREMRKEMQEKGAPESGPGRGAPGSELAGMMQKMMGSRGGSPQDRAMMQTMKGLRADMKEIKDYLRKILAAVEE